MLCHGIRAIERSSSMRYMPFSSSCQGHISGPRAQGGYVCHKVRCFGDPYLAQEQLHLHTGLQKEHM